MGAGCYYTHDCNKQLACWIQFAGDIELSDIGDIGRVIRTIGYSPTGSSCEFRNGLFKVNIKQYSNNCLVIYLNPCIAEYDRQYGLALANHARAERKLLRTLLKHGREDNSRVPTEFLHQPAPGL